MSPRSNPRSATPRARVPAAGWTALLCAAGMALGGASAARAAPSAEDKAAAIDQELDGLGAYGAKLRENQRELRDGRPGDLTLVTAWRHGPEVRRIRVETRFSGWTLVEDTQWLRGRLVRAHWQRLEVRKPAAEPVAVSDHRAWFEADRPILLRNGGTGWPLADPAGAARAQEMRAQAHSMLRLVTAPAPAGRESCTWVCAQAGARPCPRFRCE